MLIGFSLFCLLLKLTVVQKVVACCAVMFKNKSPILILQNWFVKYTFINICLYVSSERSFGWFPISLGYLTFAMYRFHLNVYFVWTDRCLEVQ